MWNEELVCHMYAIPYLFNGRTKYTGFGNQLPKTIVLVFRLNEKLQSGFGLGFLSLLSIIRKETLLYCYMYTILLTYIRHTA